MTILLALVWTIPAILRTYRMAKFYQLEEYMSDRFLRWLQSKRNRWFPRIPAITMLTGVVFSFILQIGDLRSPIVHFGLWVFVAALVSLPEPVKETKKEFVRTERATRLLGASFAVVVITILALSIVLVRGDQSPASLSTVALLGFVGFLLSPLALPAGNAVMFPYEEQRRRRFREQAEAKLAATDTETIGITGSYGKTSTKTFLTHILSSQFKAYPTPKSYNTIMGVSLAINTDFDTKYGYDYFIAEMGAYVPGEIAGICALTHPKMSIVTAVGPMHLERFKTIENIVKAKYEIVENLPPDGVCFFNGDNDYVLGMTKREYPATRIIVSYQGLEEARFVAESVEETLDGLRFDVLDKDTGQRAAFQTELMGMHNVTNILLATAAAVHLGMSLEHIAKQVKTLQSAEHRLRRNVLPNGITIIDDAYSANPVGARAALDALKLHTSGRRILITPGMVELAELEDEENFKLAQYATYSATDIVLVGIEQTQAMQRGIAETDFDSNKVLVMDTFDAAREWFQANVQVGDTVLFLNDLPDTYI